MCEFESIRKHKPEGRTIIILGGEEQDEGEDRPANRGIDAPTDQTPTASPALFRPHRDEEVAHHDDVTTLEAYEPTNRNSQPKLSSPSTDPGPYGDGSARQ